VGAAPISRETLFAMASAPGRAAIAVWRLSGPDCAAALRLLTGRPLPPPRRAALRKLIYPATGEALDQALVLWFPGPHSFTGEDCAEVQTHGGRAVADAMFATLAALPGLRPAEPGEFSRRAFVNGKLDLTQAEAIADLTAAETEQQRRQALSQASGALRALYEGWRADLIRVRAHLEAAMEFPEEDIGDPAAAVAGDIAALRDAVALHLADARRGERRRGGVTIAVIGAPNAGKSSLVNALAQREVAIVSAEAGTTRDAIEVHLDLGGFAAVVIDTAGLRDATGVVEAEGIARARRHAAAADVVLALFAADAAIDPAIRDMIDPRTIVATSKIDLGDGDMQPEMAGLIGFSAQTGQGMTELVAALTDRVAALAGDARAPAPTRARHREALAACGAALDAAQTAPLAELMAEELRRAADALGRITGRVDVEEMLDSIFREFCIGK
jgi:tRNA modification GTPase